MRTRLLLVALLSLIFLGVVNAVVYVENLTNLGDFSQSQSSSLCANTTITYSNLQENLNITRIFVSRPEVSANSCGIYNGTTLSRIAQGTITSGNCDINTRVYNGSKYLFCVDSQGVAFTDRYTGTVSFPYVKNASTTANEANCNYGDPLSGCGNTVANLQSIGGWDITAWNETISTTINVTAKSYPTNNTINTFNITFGSEIPPTDYIHYWSFNNRTSTTTYDTGGANATFVNSAKLTSPTEGLMLNASTFNNATSDYLNVGDVSNLEQNSSYSYSFWIYLNETTQTSSIYSKSTYSQINLQSGKLTFTNYLTGSERCDDVSGGSVVSANVWHNVIAISNSSKCTIFLDGVQYNSATGNSGVGNTADVVQIGGNTAVSKYFKGKIDEFKIWNRPLNSTEISTLSQYKFYETSGGSIVINNEVVTPTLQNFTVRAPNYLSNVSANRNVSADFTEFLHQSEINFSAFSKFAGMPLTGNFTVGAQSSNTGIFFLDAGTYNVTFSSGGWFDKTLQFTVSTLQRTTQNVLGVYSHLLNVTTKRFQDNNTINVFNGTIYVSIPEFYYSTNASLRNCTIPSGYSLSPSCIATENGSTNNGVLQFQTINNTDNNITISSAGYTSENATFTVTNISQIINFFLEKLGSISITFYNENPIFILDYLNVSLERISDDSSYNSSTSTGTLYMENISNGWQLLKFWSPNHERRTYYINMSGQVANISLYLLNNSDASNITATVRDQYGTVVQGAYIKVLRYDLQRNSYILREIDKTNFEGTAKMVIEPYDAYYKFLIDYDGRTVFSSSETTVTTSSLSYNIVVGSQAGDNYFTVEGIAYDLSFNNATQNFRFIFNDVNNRITGSCLTVYTTNALSRSVYNQTCINASSGTILINAPNVTDLTYQAVATIDLSPTTYYLASYYKTWSIASVFSSIGWTLTLLVTLTFALITVWSPTAAAVLTPIPILLASISHLIDFSIQSAIGLLILGIITAIILKSKGEV